MLLSLGLSDTTAQEVRSPVKKWLANFSSRPGTAIQYKSRFNNYLEWAKDDPQSLLEKAYDVDWLADHMGAYWEHLNSRKLSPLTKHDLLSTIRSFYKWNNKALPMAPKGYKGAPVAFESDKIYSLAERRMFFATSRSSLERAVLTLMNDTALRIGTLRGLRWGMIADQMDSDCVVMEIPGYLPDHLGHNCNKTSARYLSAFGEDSIASIKELVSERLMHPQSFIFSSDSPAFGGQEAPMSLATLERVILNLAERAGIQKYIETNNGRKRAVYHAHGFRRLFSDSFRAGCEQLHLPVDDQLRNFLLGHKLAYKGAYDKFRFEYIQRIYRELYPFIRILPEERQIEAVALTPHSVLNDNTKEIRSSMQEELWQMVIRHENRLSRLEEEKLDKKVVDS